MKKLVIIILSTLLFACSDPNKLTVVFDDAGGLQKGNLVSLNNLKIGTVTNIELDQDYKICAAISLDKWIKIPRDSKFQMESFWAGIKIIPGKSRQYLVRNDTIYGTPQDAFPLDSLLDFAADAINNSKPVRNQDTLVSELDALNKKLDKLNKELQDQKR